ncbi:MAG: serine protease [Saprospiraceae bacterium]|nr:serine protease [Saprospiraceae bacterium]
MKTHFLKSLMKVKYLFIFLFITSVSGFCQTSIDKLNEKFETNKVSVLLVYTVKDTNVSQGSAFLIGPDGLAVSNYHVFDGKENAVAIDYNKNEYENISIIYANPDLDIIVFRIQGIQLPYLKIASNQPSIGESCFAIGNPLGLDQTLSTGIISGYRDNEAYIQTSAEITHGSSGGPLFNSLGEVVGITTSGFGQANLNFAINLTKININDIQNRSTDTPDKIVKKYLTHLGNREFIDAYSLTDNPLWISKGGLPWFISKNSFGSIQSVKILEVRTETINQLNAVIYAHYYADDPAHESRLWEQYYFLEKRLNGWVVVKVALK